MARFTRFDPGKIIETPEALGRTSDALNAAARKRQAVLHQQRVGAAMARLRRAEAAGAPAAEVAILRQNLSVRQARLLQAAAAFSAVNTVTPQPKPDSAQVIGSVIGKAEALPLTAALVGSSGQIEAEAKVEPGGSFLLEIGEGGMDVRLQISDAGQQVLFRDAEAETLALGSITGRQVTLSGPVKPPAPAPGVLRMPDLVGQTEEAACAILFRLGVRDIDIKQRRDDGTPGLVLAHQPKAGANLDPAQGAALVVSTRKDGPGEGDEDPTGPREADMPDFVGLQLREAARIAKMSEIEVKTLRRPADAEPGEVIRQAPDAGTRVEIPSGVTLTVSTGPEAPQPDQFTVPDLVGRDIDEAERIARELDFKLTRRPVRRDGRVGLVLAQDPAAGVRVARPATVTVQVTTGRDGDGDDRDRFADRLSGVLARDDRLGNAGLTATDIGPLVATLGIRDRQSAERIVELDNAELRTAAGLRSGTQARSLRAALKRALDRMG
jgi:beta-lactam-binding protein with PASTA domain